MRVFIFLGPYVHGQAAQQPGQAAGPGSQAVWQPGIRNPGKIWAAGRPGDGNRAGRAAVQPGRQPGQACSQGAGPCNRAVQPSRAAGQVVSRARQLGSRAERAGWPGNRAGEQLGRWAGEHEGERAGRAATSMLVVTATSGLGGKVTHAQKKLANEKNFSG